MRSGLRTGLIALGLVTTTPLLAMAQSSGDERLPQRLDSLEARLLELERRVTRLEAAPGSAPARSTAVAGNAGDLANWRRLRERMSYEDVRSLLGEPEKVDGGSVAFWRYPNRGTVTFVSGELTSWSEPSR